MKIILTPEQSSTLKSKGIRADKAREKKREYTDLGTFIGNELIFTLADLLSLLPKEIENGLYNLELSADKVGWDVIYRSYHEGYEPYHIASDKELIDAFYTALLWCIENEYVDLSK